MRTTLLALAIACLSVSINAQDRHNDSLILVKMYQNLDGDNWDNPENWLSSLPLNEWEGITISENRITQLELINQHPNGEFPVEIIGLDQLKMIYINNGYLTGNLPAELIKLQKLEQLTIIGNQLSGDIPNIFQDLPNLIRLILTKNKLTGNLPDLGHNLSIVSLDQNLFSGIIPMSWEGANANYIDISKNNLSGSFSLFSTMPNITNLNISNNNWDQSGFPVWIQDMDAIESINFGTCNIAGSIPTDLDLDGLIRTKYLEISHNDISGDLTKLLPNPENTSKMYLVADNNNFSGTLNLDNFRNINRLFIGHNNYDSIISTIPLDMNTLSIIANKFNYQDLTPLLPYLNDDSDVSITYRNQQPLLLSASDTIHTSTQYLIESGDDHPQTKYQWLKNNNHINNQNQSTLTLDITNSMDSGEYTCELKNDSFPDLTLTRSIVDLTVNITTSTEDITESIVKTCIYPNPTSDFMTIDSENTDYMIYTMHGEMITRGHVNSSQKINLSTYCKGNYLIVLNNKNGLSYHKIILN